jgi:RimJ/RimL family protein N-acetyltransferase
MPTVRLPYRLPGPLRGPRVLLRPMTMDDVDDIHAYQSLPDVCRYMTFEPRTRDQVADKVRQYAQALVLEGDGSFWQLAIERADAPGRVIGDVYFTIRSVEHATGEVGWTLHPAFGGRGYMTEAAGLVLGVAFEALGLHRVIADLDARNDTSAALCRRLGMRQEAHFVEDLWFKGAWGDTLIYALLARDWVSPAAPRGGAAA